MIWIIVAVGAIAIVAFFEWKARDTPLVPGLRNHWDAHNAATNHERPLTGGHDTNRRV